MILRAIAEQSDPLVSNERINLNIPPSRCLAIVQWLLKTGLSVIPVISLIEILQPDIITGEKEPDFLTLIAIFSGVSLVQLTSASVYNWFISPSHEPQGWYWRYTKRSFVDRDNINSKEKNGNDRSEKKMMVIKEVRVDI